jgi:predicted TIM-barrel fold metal-dependent hydrolase
MEPYIDAHSHIGTPDVAHYPLAAGYSVADLQPGSFTAEELLAQCRPVGVGRVNLIQMSFYEFDNPFGILTHHAAPFSVAGNDRSRSNSA